MGDRKFRSESIDRMEELFAHSDERVLMAQKVYKVLPGKSTITFRKQGKAAGKERMLCLTAKRRGRTQGFRGLLHTCKPAAGGRFQLRQSLPMAQLTRIAVEASPTGDGRETLELVFSSTAFSGDTRWIHEVASATERTLIVRALYLFCTRHEQQRPTISGMDHVEVESWARERTDLEAEESTSPTGESGELVEQEHTARGGPGLVSAKEARDLQALLDMFSLGYADVEEFQLRLNSELGALEAANVHAILESGPQASAVAGAVTHAEDLLEDLEEALATLDTKLRHMREDIAAIEARNNNLELQTRNSSKLLASLDGLLSSLELSADTQRVLARAACDVRSIPQFADAGWELQRRLADLQPAALAVAVSHGKKARPTLSPDLLGMAAVQEQKSRLQRMTRTFTQRVGGFLAEEFAHIADSTLNQVSPASGGGALPDHGAIRDRAELLSPLMQVVRGLQPSALPPLREAYCASLNALLRRELRAVAAQLRRNGPEAGGAGSKGSPGGAGLGPGSPLHSWRFFLMNALPLMLEEAQFAAEFMELYLPPEPPSKPAAVSAPSDKASPSAPPGRAVRFQGAADANAADAASSPVAAGSPGAAGGLGGTAEQRQGQNQVLGPDGRRAIDALFDGLATEFHNMVNAVAKAQGVHAVPMLGVALAWRSRLQDQPCTAPLAELLDDCAARLLSHFEKGLWDRVTAITRYTANSLAALHVLPAFADFAAFASAMEEALLGTATDLGNDLEALQLPETSASAAQPSVMRLMLGDTAATPTAGPALDAIAEDAEPGSLEAASGAYLSEEEVPEAIPAAADVRSARDVAAPAYAVLARSAFATLERLAGTDAKHADRLRLENYAYFEEASRGVARRVRVVAFFRSAAAEAKEMALLIYIQQQLEYAKMWKLLEFSQRVDQLLEEVAPNELAFQLHYSAADLRALLATCMAQPEKKLAVMRDRVRKHLAATPPLCEEVWRSLEQVVLERYNRLSEQVAACYAGIILRPSPGELQQLFRQVAAPWR